MLPSRSHTMLWIFALALTLSAGLLAQQTPAVPGVGAAIEAGQLSPPVEAVELPPLVFIPELPTGPIASVNGKVITEADLLKLVLDQNFGSGVSALVMGKIADIEAASEKLTVSDEEVNEELTEMLVTAAPGKSLADIEKDGNTSLKHLRAQARTMRTWKKLFWTKQNIPEDQRTGQTQQLLMQFFMKTVMEKYDRRIRGQNPQPLPGTVAQIIQKDTNNEIYIGASEALDFLMGLVKLSGMTDARNELVERAVLDHEISKAAVKVSESEVATWAAEQRAKHSPPFTWEQVLRLKGTTPEREMERWRRVQAWKLATKLEPKPEDIEKFLNDHKGFFLGQTKKVSHILIRTVDEVSGIPLSEEAQAKAAETAALLHQKLEEGVEFGWLAENYSDDTVTAKGKGRLGQPIKEWGGGLDVEFQKAAWSLVKVGDLGKPVKSAYGWHVIKLEEISNPAARQEPNWKEPRYWDWIKEEFETKLMTDYLHKLKKSANVKLEPDTKVFDLKKRKYWSAP